MACSQADREIPMKTILVVSVVLAVLGLVGHNDEQMSMESQAHDTVAMCQKAEDSYYDGQLHDREAEDNCSEMIARVNDNNQYEILYKDGSYWSEKK